MRSIEYASVGVVLSEAEDMMKMESRAIVAKPSAALFDAMRPSAPVRRHVIKHGSAIGEDDVPDRWPAGIRLAILAGGSVMAWASMIAIVVISRA